MPSTALPPTPTRPAPGSSQNAPALAPKFLAALLLSALLLALLPIMAAAASPTPTLPEPALVERVLLDGRVRLLAPENFLPLSAEERAEKYPPTQGPTEVLSNDTGTVNLSLNLTAAPVPDNVDVLREALSAPYHQIYTGAEWLADEVTEINGRRFVHFEMRTPTLDSELYNIIYATPLEGKMLLITFNANPDDLAEWLEKGRAMVASLRLAPSADAKPEQREQR